VEDRVCELLSGNRSQTVQRTCVAVRGWIRTSELRNESWYNIALIIRQHAQHICYCVLFLVVTSLSANTIRTQVGGDRWRVHLFVCAGCGVCHVLLVMVRGAGEGSARDVTSHGSLTRTKSKGLRQNQLNMWEYPNAGDWNGRC
jgi:Pyruvate/2-oxoacid:ferredoxin oxidoreductase delta subunit